MIYLFCAGILGMLGNCRGLDEGCTTSGKEDSDSDQSGIENTDENPSGGGSLELFGDRISLDDGGKEHEFGHAVAATGNYVLVGSPNLKGSDPGPGEVFVFEDNGRGTFSRIQTLIRSDLITNVEDGFGYDVVVDKGLVCVSTRMDPPFSNAVYLFELGEGVFHEVARLIPAEAEGNRDVEQLRCESLSEGRVAVVSEMTQDYSDTVSVFEKIDDSFVEVQVIEVPDTKDGYKMVNDVALDGDQLVVSASSKGDPEVEFLAAGRVWVFSRTQGNYVMSQELDLGERVASVYFGTSVALDGDRILVLEDPGSAHFFSFEDPFWIHSGSYELENAGNGNRFFRPGALDLVGSTAVVGVDVMDDNLMNASAMIFSLGPNGGEVVSELPHSPSSSGDRFGAAVSLTQDRVVVGSPSSQLPGYNGGGAFIYQLIDGDYQQMATVSANDQFGSDYFTQFMIMDGERLLMGLEGQRATEQVGALYLFEDTNGGWMRSDTLLISEADPESLPLMWPVYDMQGDTIAVCYQYSHPHGAYPRLHIFEENASGRFLQTESVEFAQGQYLNFQSVTIDEKQIALSAVKFLDIDQYWGTLFFFEKVGNSWKLIDQIDEEPVGAAWGKEIFLDREWLVVSDCARGEAPREYKNYVDVHVYRRGNSGWKSQQTLRTPSDDDIVYACAADFEDNALVVLENRGMKNSVDLLTITTKIYLYELKEGQFSQPIELPIPELLKTGFAGRDVDLYQGMIALSTNSTDIPPPTNLSTVFLYERFGEEWTATAIMPHMEPRSDIFWETTVVFDGDYLAVDASEQTSQENGQNGVVFVFNRNPCSRCNYYLESAVNYQSALHKISEAMKDFTWSDTCDDFQVNNQEEVYFCETMSTLCDYQRSYNGCIETHCEGKDKIQVDCEPSPTDD